MRLRTQLLALLLVTLLLPWAGCQTVRELEEALRAGQAQTLEDTARAMAAVLATSTGDRQAHIPAQSAAPGVRGEQLFVHRLSQAPETDGFDADWPMPPEARHRLPDGISWLRLGRSVRHLHLFVSIVDDVVLTTPGAGRTGELMDRILVKTTDATGENVRRWVFAAEAPGLFTPVEADAAWRASGRVAPTLLAYWQPRGDGYQVEIRIPLTVVGARLGVGFVDVDQPGGPAREVLSWSRGFLPGLWLESDEALAARLERLLPAGIRGEVLDAEGWRLAAAGSVSPVARPDPTGPLLSALRDRWFTWWLEGSAPARPLDPREPVARTTGEEVLAALAGEATSARYRGPEGTRVAVAVPLTDGGALLLEQGSAEIVTLGNRTLTRMLTLALLFAGLLAVLLLGYASWLSWRVRRLSRAAALALGPRGEVRTALPGSAGRDELGDLSRSFSALLGRVAGYTGYLRGLGSRLSHEMKTPLAIVSASLENLRDSRDEAALEAGLARAREGTLRLQRILAALTEASQAEDMLRSTPRERYAPTPVVASCAEAYASLHPQHRIEARLAEGPVAVDGSPELLAQALDKLVDNAVDFTPAGGRITLGLAVREDRVEIAVSNEGPALPQALTEQLFDSLVSMRERHDGQPHLGLGLFVVRLVAEFHGGHVLAENIPGGVCFVLSLPRADAP